MIVAIAKWTLDEYHRMIDAGVLEDRRVELIRGEIIEVPPEGKPHAYFMSESGDYLAQVLGDRAKIRRAHPITLPNNSEPEPDIAIVQPLGRKYLEHHPYPENVFWIIEYSEATLKKDLELKSSVYAEVDILEYWVVNLKARSLIVFRHPKSGQYTQRTDYTSGSLSPLAFPDIKIAINALVN